MDDDNMDANNGFFDKVALLIEQARKFVGRTADLTMCVTYFEIGRMIVEPRTRRQSPRRIRTRITERTFGVPGRAVWKRFFGRTFEKRETVFSDLCALTFTINVYEIGKWRIWTKREKSTTNSPIND